VASATFGILVLGGLFYYGLPAPEHRSHEPFNLHSQMLEMALTNYLVEYGYLPFAPVDSGKDGELDNRAVVNLFADMTPARNPKQINFPLGPPEWIKDGQIVDHWKNPWHLAADGDGDGEITIGARVIRKRVAVWSNGPNGRDEKGEGDDVCSWK
jgi:hypothetical protein